MPFVLKHKQTSQIATDTLINVYDLPYYGVKFWHDEATAAAEKDAYLKGKNASDQNSWDIKGKDMSDQDAWEVIEVEEMAMKLFNVKLKNNPSLRLYLDEQGKAYVQEVSENK